MMTAFALIILKLWLASAAIATVWTACRWSHINAPVFPAAAVLILCGAIRALA